MTIYFIRTFRNTSQIWCSVKVQPIFISQTQFCVHRIKWLLFNEFKLIKMVDFFVAVNRFTIQCFYQMNEYVVANLTLDDLNWNDFFSCRPKLLFVLAQINSANFVMKRKRWKWWERPKVLCPFCRHILICYLSRRTKIFHVFVHKNPFYFFYL